MASTFLEINVALDGVELAAIVQDEIAMFGVTIAKKSDAPDWHIAVKYMGTTQENFVTAIKELNGEVRNQLVTHFDSPSCFDLYDTLVFLIELMKHIRLVDALKSV